MARRLRSGCQRASSFTPTGGASMLPPSHGPKLRGHQIILTDDSIALLLSAPYYHCSRVLLVLGSPPS